MRCILALYQNMCQLFKSACETELVSVVNEKLADKMIENWRGIPDSTKEVLLKDLLANMAGTTSHDQVTYTSRVVTSSQRASFFSSAGPRQTLTSSVSSSSQPDSDDIPKI